MRRTLITAAVLATLAHAFAWGDELAEQGRAIVEKNGPAIVTIRLVIKQQFSMEELGSEENEYTQETTGTVIDPDGLIVASLSELDPARMMESMGGFFDDSMTITTNLNDLTILLENGQELKGKVVLRDNDLDMAFIRPAKRPDQPLIAVDLKQEGTVSQFDQVMIVYRMGIVAARKITGDFVRVGAVLDKPRLFYVLGEYPYGLGSPVFTEAGACLGISLLRSLNITSNSAGGSFSGDDMNMAGVVLPSVDVLEAAGQAPGYEE